MSKSLKWYFRRHSLLYRIRFKLVSKKSPFACIEDICYNSSNPKNDILFIYFEINQHIFTEIDEVLPDQKKAKK